MFFDAPDYVGTLLSGTLLGLVIVVAVISHAPIEVVNGDGTVDAAGVVVEGHCAVHPAGVACAVGVPSATA